MTDTVATYYDQPLLKKPVWVWSIPVYFYVGAAAGASLALGAATQLTRSGSPDFVQRCRWMGLFGVTAGTGLLIYDLGRRSRFINMLRVFRPTSPMNVGSWLLSATGSLAGLALVSSGAAGNAAAVGAGFLGIPLSGYTGVLLANTAVPVWQAAGTSLPALFVASGMASAGSLFHLIDLSERDAAIVRRFAIVGQGAELATMFAVEQETSRSGRAAQPIKTGTSGFLWKAAKVLGAASLALSIFSRNSALVRRAAGIWGTAAAISLRFSLLQAGRNSVADSRTAIEQQRRQMETADLGERKAA